jgi:hypothetical protein
MNPEDILIKFGLDPLKIVLNYFQAPQPTLFMALYLEVCSLSFQCLCRRCRKGMKLGWQNLKAGSEPRCGAIRRIHKVVTSPRTKEKEGIYELKYLRI